LFKELGLVKSDEIDLNAVSQYLDTAFEDKNWTESYKLAAEICYKEVMANLPSIKTKFEADPYNIKQTDCDVKFMAIHSCVSLETFIVSLSVHYSFSNITFIIFCRTAQKLMLFRLMSVILPESGCTNVSERKIFTL
jgi:hypothetical protein